jgi:hypothetical protein
VPHGGTAVDLSDPVAAVDHAGAAAARAVPVQARLLRVAGLENGFDGEWLLLSRTRNR